MSRYFKGSDGRSEFWVNYTNNRNNIRFSIIQKSIIRNIRAKYFILYLTNAKITNNLCHNGYQDSLSDFLKTFPLTHFWR